MFWKKKPEPLQKKAVISPEIERIISYLQNDPASWSFTVKDYIIHPSAGILIGFIENNEVLKVELDVYSIGDYNKGYTLTLNEAEKKALQIYVGNLIDYRENRMKKHYVDKFMKIKPRYRIPCGSRPSEEKLKN